MAQSQSSAYDVAPDLHPTNKRYFVAPGLSGHEGFQEQNAPHEVVTQWSRLHNVVSTPQEIIHGFQIGILNNCFTQPRSLVGRSS